MTIINSLSSAASALAALGIGCTTIAADGPPNAPVACAIEVSKSGGGLSFEGTVQAHRDVTGAYEFVVEKAAPSGSATIRQSGDFTLKAGASEVLGAATLSGRRSDFDAELTVSVGGRTYRCGGSDRSSGPTDT